MAKLKCPRCKSPNVQLIGSNANIRKTKKSSSLNLNPFKPLTVFNHKEKQIKKKSTGKIAMGIATGGVSTLFTGSKQSKGNEFHCVNCGTVFKK